MKERIFKFTILFSVVAVIAGLVLTLPVLAGKPPKDPPPANHLIIVDKDGNGDFTDPIEAVNSITDASDTNPYLVKINPGIYDLGDVTLQMKSYVDIEGSGENTTKLTGTGFSGVVAGASDAELRFLTVEAIGGGTQAIGIWNAGLGVAVNSVIRNITVKASNANGSYAIYVHDGKSITVDHVTAMASNGIDVSGVTVGDGSLMMTNSTIISEKDGMRLVGDGSVATIHRSIITGGNYSIRELFDFLVPTVNISLSQLDGPISSIVGTYNCFQVYDANYIAVTCP